MEKIFLDKEKINRGCRLAGYKNLRQFCIKEDFSYGSVLNAIHKGTTTIYNKTLRNFIKDFMRRAEGKIDEVNEQKEGQSLYEAYCKSVNEPTEKSAEKFTREDSTPPQRNTGNLEKVVISKEEITFELFKGNEVYCNDSLYYYKMQDEIICKYKIDAFSEESNLLLVNATLDVSSGSWYVYRRKVIRPQVGHWYKLMDNTIAYCQAKNESAPEWSLITSRGEEIYDDTGSPINCVGELYLIKEEINV